MMRREEIKREKARFKKWMLRQKAFTFEQARLISDVSYTTVKKYIKGFVKEGFIRCTNKRMGEYEVIS
jgi:Fic family protein